MSTLETAIRRILTTAFWSVSVWAIQPLIAPMLNEAYAQISVGILAFSCGAYICRQEWLPHLGMAYWKITQRGKRRQQPIHYVAQYVGPVMFLFPPAERLRQDEDQYRFRYTPLFKGKEFYSTRLVAKVGEFQVMINWLPGKTSVAHFQVFIDQSSSGIRVVRPNNPYIIDNVNWWGTHQSVRPIPGPFPGDTVYPMGWIIEATKKQTTANLVVEWTADHGKERHELPIMIV
jgi:hypothetical protein